ncbi:MAG: iron-sulfur cluster insertion protein ErpA [Rickettsiales bacterium]
MTNQAEITISLKAKLQLEKLVAAANNQNILLRISVSGGGCSGFQYHFDFNETQTTTDLKIITDNKLVGVIDENSYNLLRGSEIDYVDELGGSYFKINNPNATNSCGCGSSFSV